MTPAQHSFGLLTLQQLEEAWPQVHQLLSKADRFSHGGILAIDILDMAREGRAHVFVLLTKNGMEAAMAVTFAAYPRIKIMNVAILAGKHTKLIHQHYTPMIERFARECGASRITAWCRPSAARFFNFITGTKPLYQVIGKDLT